MADNFSKTMPKKKKKNLDKSALVEEIINEHKEKSKMKPGPLISKQKNKPLIGPKCAKKMRKDDETLPNSTMAFGNGLGSFSTPKKEGTSSKEGNVKGDSVEQGKTMFTKLIAPVELGKFMNEHWERKCLHVKRRDLTFYQHLMSIETIDKMLKSDYIEYTKNIDITSYVDGVRETKNPEGRAKACEVWDFYEQGCSIRILNPQTYIEEVYKMNATIQEYFHCMTGTNVYLTPPNSQGFAPHYDDIEAFVLQIEGRKHWRLYKPHILLPRESSRNFEQSEIGSPILDVILEPGDLLYFPRGYIHQANTVPGNHSLHITMSVYQKQSYADFFEIMVTGALHDAINDDVELRKGLPLDFHQNLGLVYSDAVTPRRTELMDKIRKMFKKLSENLPIDETADQMAKKYQQDALPPYMTEEERNLTSFDSDFEAKPDGEVVFGVEIDESSKVKLVCANVLR